MRLVSAGILRPTTESEKNKNCNKREFGGILIIYVSDCIYNISLPNIFISVRQFQFKKRTNEWINSGRLSLGFWVIISSHTFYFIKLNFSRLHLSFNFSGLRVMEKLNWSFLYVVYGGLHTALPTYWRFLSRLLFLNFRLLCKCCKSPLPLPPVFLFRLDISPAPIFHPVGDSPRGEGGSAGWAELSWVLHTASFSWLHLLAGRDWEIYLQKPHRDINIIPQHHTPSPPALHAAVPSR